MASNENQGMQIALIMFVALTLVMSVLTFYFYRTGDQQRIQAEKDRADRTKAETAARTAEAELAELKNLIGFEGTMATADVKKAAQGDAEKQQPGDFDKFAATLPAEQRTYRAALQLLSNTLADASKNLVTNQDQVRTLKDRNEERETVKEKQITEHRTAAETAQADLAARLNKFNEDVARLESEKNKLAQSLEQTTEELKSAKETAEKDVAKLNADVALAKNQLKQKDRQIAELRGDVASVADGTIRSVNQKRGLVWIDLGESDHLPRQLTFSVYGVDNNGVAKGERKAAIEVTQLLGPHLAEARILEDKILDPIVRGDQIYTPLWQPGRPERFALAGYMDIDNDGDSDRVMVHDLIAAGGGLIDAELDDAGKQTGEITLNTRFLVVGEEKEELRGKIGALKSAAESLGVEILSMERFLEHAGWTETKETLQYGVSKAEEFVEPKTKFSRQPSSGHNSAFYKKRHPRDFKPTPAKEERTDNPADMRREEPDDAAVKARAPAGAPGRLED